MDKGQMRNIYYSVEQRRHLLVWATIIRYRLTSEQKLMLVALCELHDRGFSGFAKTLVDMTGMALDDIERVLFSLGEAGLVSRCGVSCGDRDVFPDAPGVGDFHTYSLTSLPGEWWKTWDWAARNQSLPVQPPEAILSSKKRPQPAKKSRKLARRL